MAFKKGATLENCLYSYATNGNIKRYALRDTTFSQNHIRDYGLTHLLEKVPNSGDGLPLKITINKGLTGFKLSIAGRSGLRFVNIFESGDNRIPQEKLYFSVNSLVERDISAEKRV